jgi:ABC-type dipeptide/oligopeptide/nickel transport system ATPase component
MILEVQNLKTQFASGKEIFTAVDDISFSIKQGETLCIVGESGSGKSVTSLSVMGLLPKNVHLLTGDVYFEGKNLFKENKEGLRKIRGNEISMIFQEPMTSLNPLLTIGFQVSEPFILHKGMSKKEAAQKACQLLEKVGIPQVEKRMKQYPHELSGGMRQRVMIAMAIALNPTLLIADEPTTALDVTIQAQILELLNELKEESNMSMMFITHDMGVVAQMADKVMVMYKGKVVEYGAVEEIFNFPQHPYTKKLLAAVPNIDEETFALV